MAKLRCYALPGPLWDLRKAESEVFVKALPRGVWPLSSRSPASPLMGAREVWASAISVEEHADPLAWVDSVRVLHASIRKHEPPSKRRPFVVLVDADFPDRFSESLESDGIEVVRAESVHVPDFLAKCGSAQRRADGLRLQLFGLTKYNKIVYLDADTLVVGDISHLFSTPSGIFLSATINGSRWGYDGPGLNSGDPMLNTGVMVIHPERDFVPSLRNALDANNWQSAREGWVRCTEAALLQSDTDVMMARLCGGPGVFTSFCTQGFVDAVFLAKGPRLGQAVWTSEATFGGCGEYGGSMSRPARPWSDHCTLDEGYNLQVTRPHLG